MTPSPSPRLIPAIEQLRRLPIAIDLEVRYGRDAVVDALRAEATVLRVEFTSGREAAASGASALPATEEDAAHAILERAAARLAAARASSLRPVINATGVIVHTNLGRAPLSAGAVRRIVDLASRYVALEYDVEAGERGRRDVHAESLLTRLTGADAAVVVNNNAAATLLTLAALARGREVIISRGELVEIGGGFRVPDVMAESGAVLREVGTTNRTRAADYAAAIGARTALILRVHPSNFRIEGFTERPSATELAALAHGHGVALAEDLGSGWLMSTGRDTWPALADEPSVRESVSAGVDIVCFSGDKLLGGPQAGIVVGRRDLVAKVRRHPLMRALRVDKVTYAALEATLLSWLAGRAGDDIPVMRMIRHTRDQLQIRARAFAERLRDVNGIRTELVDGFSTIGGGSAPGSRLPTVLIALECEAMSADTLAAQLRRGPTPVVARIDEGRVVLDLRTVDEAEEAALIRSVRDCCE